MKNFKQIFSFILTLSLSALYSYPKSAYETNTNITQDNTNIFLISTENENSQNNFIDISSNEYVEVFTLNDKLIYVLQSLHK